jgi:hypothetical protein
MTDEGGARHPTTGLDRTTPLPCIQPTPLSAQGNPLGLLDEPWPFSQLLPLDSADFAKAAIQRRIALPGDHDCDVNALEELHRVGLLVPLLAVDRTYRHRTSLIDLEAVTRGEPRSSTMTLLCGAHAAGLVADPAVQPFLPWAGSEQDYYYSAHQLLGLASMTQFLAPLERYVDSTYAAFWRLPEASWPKASDLEAATSWRSFAIALTYLDTAYRPEATRQLRGLLAAWRTRRQTFDSGAAMRRFGDQLDDEQIYNAVMALRVGASYFDDLGKFYDVVRRSDGEAWDSLRGGVRIAMDFRIAAEMLERCAADAGFTVPEFPPNKVPLHQQRLRNKEWSLDSALTKLRLSPHPSVVLALEGETEELLVPRILKLLGFELAREWITVDCFGGAGKDLTSLARYAATPIPGMDMGESVLLDRPVTRFLVLVDEEEKYETEDMREAERVKLLTEIAKQLPHDLRPDIVDPSGFHVEIRTWGRLPFEFEHYTDEEMAEGLETAADGSHPFLSRAELIKAVRDERRRRKPNIEHAWTGEGPNKLSDGPKKVKIADALWPTLERKIQLALDNGDDGPPILQGVLRAVELALITPRSNVVLRLR